VARLAVTLLWATVSAPALSGQAERDTAESPVRLMRCRSAVDMACFVIRGTTGGGARADSGLLHARLDGARLIGPGESHSEQRERIRLLVLFDVSGSMLKDDAIAVTRLPLRTFLRGLPSSVSAAVAPFESRGVQQVIASARFVLAPQIDAQLDRLPAPRRNGNTALYSAITLGLARLDVIVRDSGGLGGLVVITDGSNDVGHVADGDDADLLDSRPANRTLVRDRIAASTHRVWLVGAGTGVRAEELRTLAGDRATATVVPMNPVTLGDHFKRIGTELWSDRSYAYGIPPTVRDGLTRRVHTIEVDGLRQSPLIWRPPLVALPPFVASVWTPETRDSVSLSPETRQVMLGISPDGTSKLLVAGPLFLVLALLRLWLPRMLVLSPPALARHGQSQVAGARPGGTLRAAVEAPPRKPTDITRDGAAV